MTLDAWRELRRQQGVRVANASRHKRLAELQKYGEICGVIAELEAEGIVLEGGERAA